MATTPNYGWVTPAPTDFVTDLPADFETFADAVDDTVKDLNPGTTAGDLDYYTSALAKARLAIGTAGQVLTVNSGATAPEWVSPSTGSVGWTLLNAGGTALTASTTITVSGLSAKELLILIDNASSLNQGVTFSIRLNNDSNQNYTYHGVEHWLDNTWSSTLINQLRTYSGATSFPIAGTMNSNSVVGSGSLHIDLTDTSGWKKVTGMGTTTGQTTVSRASGSAYWYQGIYEASAAITQISVISSSGNFDSGTVYVLGAN